MSLVVARGLVKRFDDGRARRPVLAGVDLDVRAGELVAVVGPSGSGKSTLLHLLGALDRMDAGTVQVAGRRLDGRPERELTRLRRDLIGFVFQFFHLVPELTGAENVLLPLRANGAGPGSARAARSARRLLDELGLAEAAGRRPHELSGGEQQRLAVARALVNRPRLVLADEPTGNLDERSGAAVLELLRAIPDQQRAVVLVTHDPAATAIADRVLQLSEGRLSS